ncbi:MAG: DUF4169 family protein [Marinovum sp.]|nr:DUF4169 family protein [Marinovum sp.]
MSDQPVNLNRFRKQKARAEKRARADANAAKFGRTKSERAAQDTESVKTKRYLDGHAVEKPENGGNPSSETP